MKEKMKYGYYVVVGFMLMLFLAVVVPADFPTKDIEIHLTKVPTYYVDQKKQGEKFYVYTEEGTFINKDSMFHLFKPLPSEIQGKLISAFKSGKKECEVKVAGIRLPSLGYIPNILKVYKCKWG